MGVTWSVPVKAVASACALKQLVFPNFELEEKLGLWRGIRGGCALAFQEPSQKEQGAHIFFLSVLKNFTSCLQR